MNMTKREVREALGFTLDRQLADFFGVGKAAVSQWDDDKPLPDGRQWQARALRPDLFPPDPDTLAAAHALPEPTQRAG